MPLNRSRVAVRPPGSSKWYFLYFPYCPNCIIGQYGFPGINRIVFSVQFARSTENTENTLTSVRDPFYAVFGDFYLTRR